MESKLSAIVSSTRNLAPTLVGHDTTASPGQLQELGEGGQRGSPPEGPKRTRLHDLLKHQREEILKRFVLRVREAPFEADKLPRPVLLDGLPGFLDQVVSALVRQEDPGAELGVTSTSAAAAEHGLQRLEIGFDIVELVREYGVLRDVVLELLIEAGAVIDLAEYKAWSRHISAGAAQAVTQFVAAEDQQRDRLVAQHFAFLAHELRHKLNGAVATLSWWQRSQATAELAAKTLDESLAEISGVLDQQLATSRLDGVLAGLELHRERITADELMLAAVRDVRSAAQLRGVTITTSVAPGLALHVDARLLRSALGNLLANAIKFTRTGGKLQLRASASERGVVLEVEDECGGLPNGMIERLFEPFVQLGENRSGFGLGLAIAQQAVEAHGGRLSADDLPGRGCIFRLELPLE